jgi:hypothetical protein
LPHVFTSPTVQLSWGSVPVATGAQMPFVLPVLAAKHDVHGPAHAMSQQTFSTQFWLAQLPFDIQRSPVAASVGESDASTLLRAPLSASPSEPLVPSTELSDESPESACPTAVSGETSFDRSGSI